MKRKEMLKPYISIFSEDIYGNKAVVYHRTQEENLINKIYTSGFKPGHGAVYGKGFYSTYDLESQLLPKMQIKYGDVIVRFIVNSLNRFFFFDYEEFLKSPVGKKLKSTKDTFIYDQVNYFKIPMPKKKLDDILKKNHDYNMSIVINTWRLIKPGVDGIVFTDFFNGKVLLSYNTNIIVPTSYSIDEGKSFQKVNSKNMEYLKNVFSQDTSNPKKYSHWIYDAKVSHADYEIINKDKILWTYGTWHNGTWHNGKWNGGTWKGGTWKDGTWENGTWENGTWENGTWENGIWEDGIWIYGEWEDGKGLWKRGSWVDGLWTGGFIYDKNRLGNFEPDWEWEGDYIQSPLSPKGYFGKEKGPY